MVKWEFEAELALKAVSTSEELALDRPERMSASSKESLRDIVSEVDIRIERHITEVLGPSGHAIVGEETFREGSTFSPEAGKPYWVVDPIDGTTNYVSGLPIYGISVGLCMEDEALVGAVAIPAYKELFFTYGDGGAFLNGKALQVADSALSRSLVAVSFSGAKGDPVLRARQYELFGAINDSSRGCLRLGSAATNLCYTAAGRLQAAYGFQARIWDVAAGIAIARQAGCRIFYRRTPGSTRVDYIVGAPSVAEEIRQLWVIKELLGAAGSVSERSGI